MDCVGSFRIALRELEQLHHPSDEVASSIERCADHRSSSDRDRMDDNILYPLFLGGSGPSCLFYMLELSLFRIADSHGLSRTEHLAVMHKDLLSHLLLSCDDGGIGFECRNMCERKNDNVCFSRMVDAVVDRILVSEKSNFPTMMCQWLRETCDALGCGQCRRTTHETESTRKSYSHLPLMVPHSIYTVHATMPTHETFFLDGYEDLAARHNMKWVRVKDKILKVSR